MLQNFRMLQMPQTLKKMLPLHDCHPALMSCCSVSETNCCRCRAETLLLPMRVQLRLLNTDTALATMELKCCCYQRIGAAKLLLNAAAGEPALGCCRHAGC
jgi:hypothetical protein